MKILAVDTDPSALQALIICLRSVFPNSEIHAYSDPLLAVKHGYNHRVDALFSEIDLKGLNGLEVALLVRKKQDLPISIIFISDNRAGCADGQLIANGFAQKPISAEKIKTFLLETE